MEGIIVLFVMSCAVIGGIGFGRFLTDGEWTDGYSQHKCGHLQQRTHGDVCGRCAEQDDNWERVVAKAAFPFGWHIKKVDRTPPHDRTT